MKHQAHTPAVSLAGVTKSFGDHHVLKGVNLQVGCGSMVAVCGPSGCGKSTLLDIVGLLESADEGSVQLMGQSAPRPRTRRATQFVRDNINYLFQSFALVETETVEKNLMMALRYVKKVEAEKQRAIQSALEAVRLERVATTKVCALSGGEQQRVALARVMLKPGKILLADEPTGSLDAANRDGVVSLLRSMADDGRAVLVVTHDPAVARACDVTVSLG